MEDWIRALKKGDKIICIKDQWSTYDVGASGHTFEDIAFEKGKTYTVADTGLGIRYVADDENCHYRITSEHFKPEHRS